MAIILDDASADARPYAVSAADFVAGLSGGFLVPQSGTTLTVWTERVGGSQVTNLLNVDSLAPVGSTITSAADGTFPFAAAGQADVLFVDAGTGTRYSVLAGDLDAGGGGGGGHIIANADTDLPQQPRLRFTGAATATDAAGETVVNVSGTTGPAGADGAEGAQGPRGLPGDSTAVFGFSGALTVSDTAALVPYINAFGVRQVTKLAAAVGVAGSSASTFTVYKNGASIGTVTVAASAKKSAVVTLATPVAWALSDDLTVGVTAAGTGAAHAQVTVVVEAA